MSYLKTLNMEVLALVSHLLITLGVLLGYISVLVFTGTADTTLQNLLLLAGGFWFGFSATKGMSGKKKDTDAQEGGDKPNE